MSNSAFITILEKIASKDKDFRYMATSDLLNELQKDTFKTDADTERKLCMAVLHQLEDASGDISGLAVKCLGILVRKVAEARAEEMARSLCDKVILGKKEQQRDIASIGLKTIIAEISGGQLATNCAAIITSKMLEGASNKDNNDVVGDSLEILTDVLGKFGGLVVSEHTRIRDCLLGQLDDSRAALRKRALQGLAAVSVYLADELLDQVITQLLGKLQQKGLKADIARTYIQSIGQISRAVGYRFGRHLSTAVPLVMSYCDNAAEGDDELREYSLQALESFVMRCPHDSRPLLDALLKAVLKYIKYDPNLADDMEEDEEEEGGDEEEDEDNGSEDQYSDDEDMSWKVRRAAAKCLSAAVSAYPDALPELYRRSAEPLIARFREREENVLVDVFAAFIELCHQVGQAAGRYAVDDPASPLGLLRADVPSTVKAAARLLKEKSPKTKIGVFGVLRELVEVLPASVAEQIALLVPGVLHALTDKSSSSSNLKIEALLFLKLAMASNPPSVFQPHVKALSPAVFAAANERYYKVAAEALRVCEQMVLVVAPAPGQPVSSELKPLVKPLFDAVMQRLCAQDQDQEVKECAILGMSTVVAQLGGELSSEVPPVLKVLLERLRNEITRLAAVKAFSAICRSPREVDLSSVLDAVLAELTSFLRKANRALRQASLQALEAVTSKYGSRYEAAAATQYVEEVALMVSDADLPLAALALRFLVTLLAKQPGLAPTIVQKVLPGAMQLVRSPLLQGAALDALQAFFSALTSTGAPAAAPDALLPELLAAGQASDAGKQAQSSVAQCVAVLCCAAGGARVEGTVTKLLEALSKAGGDAVAGQRLALLCLGAIGRRADLSKMPQVEAAITQALGAESDEIRGAASLALGGLACGNLPHYMPSLLRQISSTQGAPKQQYLLLQALSEVITTIAVVGQAKIDLSASDTEQVLTLLLSNCEAEEECRNVVAECLGHLALLHPERVLAALQQRISSPSANVRTVVVSAIKYTVVEKPHPVDEHLQRCVLDFLSMMSDPDRHVRRAAVVALSAVAHQKAVALVAMHLGALLPKLYEQTVVREDMIRTVDLGPFKHKIDDGLELRKAAFECLDILLDSCRGQLETSVFVSHLESGLKDHPDVKSPCHLMLAKVAASDPTALLAGLEKLVEPLEKTLTTKLKSDAVKQEVDRHEDMLRSCLRAVDAVNRIPAIDTCAPFQAFMKRTVMAGPLKDKFLQIERERAEAEGGDAMDLS
eukprot:CAMPEP_0202892974 /NCGR_PEP_ID=MMETSP1392-20130828/2632_1 /ASSEMBLY_ACC=CAM_ASM_000868 /TAXON_ID=225041 /ORGANISM="Chlamydomonas chlamydogama, Strain SAG 11-48b" /LENGTH=1235 /DNA_ID=CAMNT_0049577131 /DNA_START=157 /DNA_END=3864 /DNA_ORIENTATION=-